MNAYVEVSVLVTTRVVNLEVAEDRKRQDLEDDESERSRLIQKWMHQSHARARTAESNRTLKVAANSDAGAAARATYLLAASHHVSIEEAASRVQGMVGTAEAVLDTVHSTASFASIARDERSAGEALRSASIIVAQSAEYVGPSSGSLGWGFSTSAFGLSVMAASKYVPKDCLPSVAAGGLALACIGCAKTKSVAQDYLSREAVINRARVTLERRIREDPTYCIELYRFFKAEEARQAVQHDSVASWVIRRLGGAKAGGRPGVVVEVDDVEFLLPMSAFRQLQRG
jgi:hypothetical protein